MLDILGVIEESGHSMGQHLTIVGDEGLPGATDIFVAAQGAGQEAAENVKKEIVCEASHYIPLVGGRLLHLDEDLVEWGWRWKWRRYHLN